MIATLWFLIKSIILVAAFAWLWGLDGLVDIDAFGIQVQTSFGIFAIILIFMFYCIAFIGRVIMAIVNAPRSLSKGYGRYSHKIGMQSLTYGLSAVAAGDAKAAGYYTKKAVRFLKDDYGLVSLLSGLTARLKGDERAAEKAFNALLKRDETSFLGIRGLLQTAIDKGDYRYARVLARKAYAQNPKQSWIIKTLYDLELRHRDVNAALPLLHRGARTGAFDQRQAKQDEAAIALFNDDLKTAYKLAPTYLPVALEMVKHYMAHDKNRRARNLIKDAWTQNPHPQLLDHWMGLAPAKVKENALRMMSHVEDLHRTNMDDASCNLYVANIALRYDFTAQAKRFLEMAIHEKPTMRAYQLMEKIEPMAGWQDLIPTAAQDKTWVCCLTGKVFDQWQAFDNENHFNTIMWNYPDIIRHHSIKTLETTATPFFITDNKAA